MNKKHFDAWGNPTLDYFGMLEYYRRDEESLRVIRSTAPYKYAVLPDIEIRFNRNDPILCRVYRIYPSGQDVTDYGMSERMIRGYRSLFLKKRKGWDVIVNENTIIIKKKGRVVRLNTSKIGVW